MQVTLAPVIIVFQMIGNKLSGKVTVPNLDPTATGLQKVADQDLLLSDLKFNGQKLSFNVSDGDNLFEGDLTRVTDDRYEGRWRSPIQGRWKGSKSEFTGALKMVRAK